MIMEHPRERASPVSLEAVPQATHRLVVIDHRQTRVYAGRPECRHPHKERSC